MVFRFFFFSSHHTKIQVHRKKLENFCNRDVLNEEKQTSDLLDCIEFVSDKSKNIRIILFFPHFLLCVACVKWRAAV